MENIITSNNIAITGAVLAILGSIAWFFSPAGQGRHWPIRMFTWGVICGLTGLALNTSIGAGWSTLLFLMAGAAAVGHVSYIRRKNDGDDDYSENDRRHPIFGLVSVAILSATILAFFQGSVLVLTSLTLGWISMLGILLEKKENWWAPRMGLWSFVVFLAFASVTQVGSSFGIIWMILLWIAGITHISILKSREGETSDTLQNIQVKMWGLVTIAMVSFTTLQFLDVIHFRDVFELSLTQN